MILKINALIRDIEINGCTDDIGKTEALKEKLSGLYSRRIDEKNRLIYRIVDEDCLEILQCKSHYSEK